MSSSLCDTLQRYFTEDYVLDSTHSFWKDMMLENDGWISAHQLYTFPDVMVAASEGTQSVLSAAAFRPDLFDVDMSLHRIRSTRPLDFSRDPNHRTICVKPIHGNTKEEELMEFFAVYGVIEKIERHTFTEFETGKQKNRPWAFIQYKEVASAERCVAAKPSFGTLNTFGRHFIPKLIVTKKNEFEQQTAEEAEMAHSKSRHAQLLKQNTATTTSSTTTHKAGGNGASPAADAAAVVHTRHVAAGSILKIPSLPEGTTWREVKTVLGDVAKGICSIVYLMPDTAPSTGMFVFLKTEKGAREVLDRYHASVCQNSVLSQRVPSMTILSGSEEITVRDQYIKSGNSQSEKKRIANEKKRKRDDSKPFAFHNAGGAQ